jgi:glycosyltransferase involved in cell wall biosynthesis
MIQKAVQFPLAIDVERYQPTLPSESLREQLGLSSDDFVIISVANLVEVKGIEVLLEAVNQLHNSKVKVLIVGGDSSEYAIALKSKYKTCSHINFIGKKLDVRPYLALSDLFVIPTKDEGRREGIPNAPLEAMSMKCIVLGSDISGVRDILKVFPDCMFKADDIASLKRKIETVMNLPESDRMKLEEQMRKRVIDEFSIDDFIDRHQSLYLELLDSN